MDGGAWQAAVHGVAKRWTGLSDFTFTFHFHALEKEMAAHSSVLAWRIPGTGGSLVGCRLWGRTESDRTAVTQQQQLPRGVLVQVSNLCVSSRSLPFPTSQGDHPSPLVSQMFISPPLFPWPLPAAPSGPPLLQALLWFTRVSACPLGCSFHHYSFSYICRAVLNLEGPQSHLEGMLAPAPEFDSTGLG